MGKTGLVIEGGAFRGVFTAGVLDVLMENNIYYDYVIGVSAGAGNALNYITGQVGRTRNIIKPRNHKENYFGVKQLVTTGKFLNLEKMFFEYPFKQFPYRFDRFYKNDTEIEIVATNCETGKAEYYGEKNNINKLLNMGMASCSVPIICKPVKIGKYHYLDGSIADSIPLERAMEQGCDKLVVIMTKDLNEKPTDYGKKRAAIDILYGNRYPKFHRALINRTKVYDREIELLNRLEKEGRALVVRPTISCIKKFEQDDRKIDEFYNNGRKVADKNLVRFMEFMS